MHTRGTVMEPTRQVGIAHHADHTAAAAAPGHTSPGGNKKGESRIKSWKVGDVKITSIMETADRIPWAPLFPAETSEHYKKYAWLVPNFVTPQGQIILAVQAFVLEIRGEKIVIDTCVGNDRSREMPQCSDLQTAFLKDFKSAGLDPNSITTVLCTHLHFDHVGWATESVN